MATHRSQYWITCLLLWMLGCPTPGRTQPVNEDSPLIWYVPQNGMSPFLSVQGNLVSYSSLTDLAEKLAHQPTTPYHLQLHPKGYTAADWQTLRRLRPATSLTLQLADSTSADSLLPILARWHTLRNLRVSGDEQLQSFTFDTDQTSNERTITYINPVYPLPRVGWDKLASLAEITLGNGVALDQAVMVLAAVPNLHTMKVEAFDVTRTGLPTRFGGLRQLRHLSIQWASSKTDYATAFKGLDKLETLSLSLDNPNAFNAGLTHLTSLSALDLMVVRTASAVSALRLGRLSALRVFRLQGFNDRSENSLDLTATFAGLTKLDTLTLTDVPLSSFPRSLLDNKGLARLFIQNAGLTNLPDDLNQLANLTHLSLNQNPLANVPTSVGRLSTLQHLSLNQCSIETLPDNLGDLRELTYLSLAANQLTRLPTSIGRLRSLRHLNLTQNQLPTLPAELGQLPNLETLILVWNQLTELPSGLGTLTQLNVAENELTSLSALGTYRQLRSLTIKGNPLGQLPDNIDRLDSLETLELGNNGLTYLPASLGTLRRLRSLTVGANQLRELPGTLGGLTSLEDLTIESDELVVLPDQLTACRNLKSLQIGGARFIGLPENIGELTKLEDLVVRGRVGSTTSQAVGRMVALPNSLTRCVALSSLSVQHQPVFDGNEALQLATQLPKLDRLTISDCQLAELGYVAWSRLTPTYLNLSQNRLSRLPANLLAMPHLRESDFSLNNLPEAINRGFPTVGQLTEAMQQLGR